MRQIKVQCPAKNNLTLKIIGKREDGFHNIESIMQTINLYDYLTISIENSEKLRIEISGTSDKIPYDKTNLVYKAAELFFDKKLGNYKIKVFIEKNIPVSAGLAGGSTNAAGMLFGLNKLLNEPYTREELHHLCSKLGSDLNFCLEGGKQMTTGRGEILEAMKFKNFNLSLIKPEKLGISAKEAYSKFSEKLKNNKNGRKKYLNDLEWGLIEDYEELKTIKRLYPNSIMSGSGSTYYLINEGFSPLNGYWIKNNLEAIPYGIREY